MAVVSSTLLNRNGQVVLARNHVARVASSRIVYRGSENGLLFMDLTILELDAHYRYRHRIDEARARRGFQLGEHYFQARIAGDGKILLKRL